MEKQIPNVRISDTLKAKVVKTDVPLFAPSKVGILENKNLIIYDKRSDSLFKVFELPKLNFKFGWGKVGRGPGQIRNGELGTNSIIIDSSSIELYNLDTGELRNFEISNNSFAYTGTNRLEYDYQLRPLHSIAKFRHGLYMGTIGWVDAHEKLDQEYQYIVLEPDNTDELFRFGEYPNNNLQNYNKYNRYRTVFDVKPSGEKVVSFFEHIDEGRIHDSSGSLVTKMKMTSEIDEEIKYRLAIQATNDLIYVHYLGDTEDSVFDERQAYKPKIEIWDWKGDLLDKIVLDKPVHFFQISEKFDKLYGVSLLVSDKIFEYDLSSIKKNIGK